jgi:hypothetical protein
MNIVVYGVELGVELGEALAPGEEPGAGFDRGGGA